MPVLYIRGLNTYGDEAVHVGPWTLGSMQGPLCDAIRAAGRPCHAVTGLGHDSLTAQIEVAKNFLTTLEEWRDPNVKWHILGHSTGGLIARGLVYALPDADRILSVATLATPHVGARLAARAARQAQLATWPSRLLRLVGYDVTQRSAILEELTAEKVMVFNKIYPDLPGVAYGSLRCRIDRRRMSWPIRLLRLWAGGSHDGDGLVEFVSQKWGRDLGVFALDHLHQIGYFLGGPGSAGHQRRLEFARVLAQLDDFWSRLEADQGHGGAGVDQSQKGAG